MQAMAAEERIVAEVHGPEVVFLPSGRGRTSIPVDILCQIHNCGEEDYGLWAEHPDEVHDWHLLDENHKELQRAPAPKGKRAAGEVLNHITQHILGNHAHSKIESIKLDARKLKPGKRYFLRFKFWGHTDETSFTVAERPSPPPKPKPPVKAKKPPAKRKIARVVKKVSDSVGKKKAAAKKATTPKKTPAKRKPASPARPRAIGRLGNR